MRQSLWFQLREATCAKAARAIEPLCQLWRIPGFGDNAWANHAFAVLRR
jgi:hypothetical protein